MQYRELGRTGLKVSEISMGCWAIGGTSEDKGVQWGWGEVPESDALAALKRARDLGVNFFDTANVYGDGVSESRIGKAFGGRWDGIHVATKVGFDREPGGTGGQNFSRAHIIDQCEKSLRRLQKDTLDLYQLHNPSLEVIKNGDWPETMERLKEQGKIRFYGCSINLPEDALALMERGVGHSIQLPFNALRQEMVADVFPTAEKKGYGIIARVALYYGILTGKYSPDTRFASNDHRSHTVPPERMRMLGERAEQLRKLAGVEVTNGEFARWSLKFAVSYPAVSTVIPGARNARQAEQNAAVGALPHLTERDRDMAYRFWSEDDFLRTLRDPL